MEETVSLQFAHEFRYVIFLVIAHGSVFIFTKQIFRLTERLRLSAMSISGIIMNRTLVQKPKCIVRLGLVVTVMVLAVMAVTNSDLFPDRWGGT